MRSHAPSIGAIALAISIICAAGCTQSATTSDCGTPPVSLTEEVCIPAATLTIGHAALDAVVRPGANYVAQPRNSWTPPKQIRLSAFWIDKYEVTWRRYRACVDAGICSRAGLNTYQSTRAALTDETLADHPASQIRYEEAATFCLWDAKRLPTEAEWERAARGRDALDYPWGNSPPSSELLARRINYHPDVSAALYPPKVGTSGMDVSPEGVHDLFASTPEWVRDWFSPSGYAALSPENPAGPTEAVTKPDGTEKWGRVVRGDRWSRAGGDAWSTETRGAPVWFREELGPGATRGFRCVRPVVPDAAIATQPLQWKEVRE